jgi:hypothetical protein
MSTVLQLAALVVGACSYSEVDIGALLGRVADYAVEFAAVATVRLKDYSAVLDGADLKPAITSWLDDAGHELRRVNGYRGRFLCVSSIDLGIGQLMTCTIAAYARRLVAIDGLTGGRVIGGGALRANVTIALE